MDRQYRRSIAQTSPLKWSFAFVDEAGANLLPAIERVWARCGQTPTLSYRGRHHEKVNMISAVLRTPDGTAHLRYHINARQTINNEQVADFLRVLHAEALSVGSAGLVVIWDNGNNHRGEPIRQLCTELSGELYLWSLPPYSPDFNPDESVWRQLKRLPEMLANFAAHTVDELATRAGECLAKLAGDATRLSKMLRTSMIDWEILLNQPPAPA